MSSLENNPDKIQYQVTRPIIPTIDYDGRGDYNISPLGFPIADVSGELGITPHLVQPNFTVGYNPYINASFTPIYTSENIAVVNTSGSFTFIETLQSLAYSGSGTIINAKTVLNHGYTSGLSILISGAFPVEYNGLFVITIDPIDPTKFTYDLGIVPTVTPAIGTPEMYSSYKTVDNSVIRLANQLNVGNNGIYIVSYNANWRVISQLKTDGLYVRANSTANIAVLVGGLPAIVQQVSSLVSAGLIATVTTTTPHGYMVGQSVTIAGATPASYNGLVIIQRVTGLTFEYNLISALTSPATGVITSTYQVLENDLINVIAQTNALENAIYQAYAASAWLVIGEFYAWNGTENDNIEGTCTVIDPCNEFDTGIPNHYRRGYSDEEVAKYIHRQLSVPLNFGQYKGTTRPIREQGAFIRWFLTAEKVNIGGSGNAQQVWIDSFGKINALKVQDRIIQQDPREAAQVARLRKTARWGISNHHSHVYTNEQKTKSPLVKDYPFAYNGQSLVNNFESGDQIPLIDDTERFTIKTGPGAVTTTSAKPFAEETLYYINNNGWHNNITLDLNNQKVHGRHNLSIVHNLDRIDYVEMYYAYFKDSNVNTVTSTITIDYCGTYSFYDGDFVFFTAETGVLPTGILPDTVYIATNTTINEVTLETLNSVPVVISSATGGGDYIIHRISSPPYRDYIIASALDDIVNNTNFVGGQKIMVKSVTGVVTKYLYIERDRNSLVNIIPVGTGWAYNVLTYSNVDVNTINVYVDPTETNFIQFHHPLKTAAEILATLKANNQLIAVPFDPLITEDSKLSELFSTTTLVDFNNPINQTAKIHSKKTFIHLPTPMDMLDGTKVELDVSLPLVPNQDSFAYPTVGTLSGYRNYVTQPRVYVLSGYQKKECFTQSVNSIVQFNGIATMTLNSQLPVYVYDFQSTDVSVDYNNINVPVDFNINESVLFYSTGTLPAPLTTTNTYLIGSYNGGAITIKTSSGTDVLLTTAGSGVHKIIRNSEVIIYVDESTDVDYNGTFTGIVTGYNKVTYTVPDNLPSPASGTIVLKGIASAAHGKDVKGLTERGNEEIFGIMPEISGATPDNVYHQLFNINSIIGNGNQVNPDKRVLTATIYPTASSTFAWRMDNDPTLRMLSWSLLNVHALGTPTNTGSFANVAYTRNKEIVDQYPSMLNFDLYNVPVSYQDVNISQTDEQFINAHIRVLLEPVYGKNIISPENADTYGSYNYQGKKAFKQLIGDFVKGRVRVNARKEPPFDFQTDAQSFLMGYDGNNTLTVPPVAFYNNFIQLNTVSPPYAGHYNGDRWMTKAIYTPDYVVNAQNATNQPQWDSYQSTPTALKNYLSTYFITGSSKEVNAGNRYVVGDIDPKVDPSFEFATGSNNAFINFLIENKENETDINDIRRRLWDSYYSIPSALDRQIQNMYQIGTATAEDLVKFYGFYWIPFAKIFSADTYAPSEIGVDDVSDYTAITGGSYPTIYETFRRSLKSNPIASIFLTDGYDKSFVSINTIDSLSTDNEDFLRNYITGYSNLMPLRFYNNFRVVVDGKSTSTSYLNDILYPVVNTESDNSRIFDYSCNDYLQQYVDNPSVDVGKFIDDNFMLRDYEYEAGKVVAEDYNSAWMYFEAGNPVTDPVNSKILDLITVSGMNYIAKRNWYQEKMKYGYARYKMSFVFSKEAGRWYCLDYRQAPLSYLTPTFGNAALSYQEKSSVATTNPNACTNDDIRYQYLWKTPKCFDSNNAFIEIYKNPYHTMSPMILNMTCYPFLSPKFPYNSQNILVPELDPNVDSPNAELYRPMKLAYPQQGINFVVPNNVHGGSINPDLNLYAWQPNMWSVYWHMRPAVCAMDGTDIPHGKSRTGGYMADPVLNDMFNWPNARNPKFAIPWFDDMNSNWLVGEAVIINAGSGGANPAPRNSYVVIDANPNNSIYDYGAPGYGGFIYGGGAVLGSRMSYEIFNANR